MKGVATGVSAACDGEEREEPGPLLAQLLARRTGPATAKQAGMNHRRTPPMSMPLRGLSNPPSVAGTDLSSVGGIVPRSQRVDTPQSRGRIQSCRGDLAEADPSAPSASGSALVPGIQLRLDLGLQCDC